MNHFIILIKNNQIELKSCIEISKIGLHIWVQGSKRVSSTKLYQNHLKKIFHFILIAAMPETEFFAGPWCLVGISSGHDLHIQRQIPTVHICRRDCAEWNDYHNPLRIYAVEI